MQWDKLLTEREWVGGLGATAVLILVVIIVRVATMRFLRRAEWSSDEQRLRWTVNAKRTVWIVFFVGLAVIWATELRTLALSIAAVGVALVVAMKELILCVLGSMLRTSGGAFHLGDRIEVNGLRGDVVDQRLLTTKILEVGAGHQRTGRALTLPNSVFLNVPVMNETYTDAFVLHVITVPVERIGEWELAEAELLKAAREVCADYVEPARTHMTRIAEGHGLQPPSVEPRVILQFPDPGSVLLHLRVPTTARDKGRTEQQILRRFLGASRTIGSDPSELRPGQ